jgi:cell division protein FtsL
LVTANTSPVRRIATAPSPTAGGAAGIRRVVGRRRPWLVFTVVVLAAFFGLIGSRISLDQSAFTIDRLEDEIVAEQTRNMALQLEIAELRDPGRIADRAAAMGMEFPGSQLPLDISPRDVTKQGSGARPGGDRSGPEVALGDGP